MAERGALPERDLDLVLDFGAGLLDDAQRVAVLERARRDRGFEALLREHLGDAEAARLQRNVRRRSARQWLWPLAAAAVLLLAIAIPMRLRDGAENDFWIQSKWQSVATRGDATAQQLVTAINAYEARNLDQAIAMLEDLALENGQEDLRLLYLASALMQSGEVGRGRAMLLELDVETLPMPWRAEAEALLKTSSK